MMKIKEYDRQKAIDYAHLWAYRRNPAYYNFDAIGGDCTSFISQCVYAGSSVMNHTKDTGWYYNHVNDRAPGWSGVPYLYQFLTTNKGLGPFGTQTSMEQIEEGDIIQLSFDGTNFVHSLFVVEIDGINDLNHIKIATHTYDSDNRIAATYTFQNIRFIHIEGVRAQ